LLERVNKIHGDTPPSGDGYIRDFIKVQEILNKDLSKELNENEIKKMFKNADIAPGHVYPRMSPEGKTRVYNDYMKGMSIRDISLKYGILQERALAIIYQREFFLKVVYPKIGETLTRMAYRLEHDYGRDNGFQDYGIDLQALTLQQQGMPSGHIFRSSIDTNPPKLIKEEVEKELGNIKGRKIFEVPIKQIGKGPKGYLLKEIIIRKCPRKFLTKKVKWAMLNGPKVQTYGYTKYKESC